MLRLSFVYHMISMVISLIATIYLLFVLLFSKTKLLSYQVATLLLLLTTSWATQGLLNFAEEYIYDFYPLSGKTTIGSEPVNRLPPSPPVATTTTTTTTRPKLFGLF